MPQQRRETPTASSRKPQLSSQVFKLEIGAFLRICEGLDTPRSLACYLLAKAGEWKQYVNLPAVDPDTSLSFKDDYLVSSIMLKNPRLPLGVDLEQAAWQKFLESEVLCNRTNRRFSSLYTKGTTMSPEDISLISRVRDKVYEVLGPLTPRRLEALPARCRFGPGATSDLRGRDVLLSRKYSHGHHATPRLLHLLPPLRGPHLADIQVDRLEYSSLQFVPKNAKTHRTICIEPHWNIYLQLGIGSMIRESLNRLGLDVNNQERNRSLAQKAQAEGLATIDLSMASDTIALRVVEFLLPPDWYHLLYSARTDAVKAYGKIIPLEKFSSMGNGYTWELETLIFYCIALVATNSKDLTVERIGIFGDDIIIDQKAVPLLQRILELFGFKMNVLKSFWQGRFRESCGSDFYDGADVRPFFFKKDKYRDIYEAATHMANAVRLYSHNPGHCSFCDVRFLRAWLYLARKSREGGSTYLPHGSGDDGLIVNLDEACPSRSGRRYGTKDGWDGWRAKVFFRGPIPATRTSTLGAYMAALDQRISLPHCEAGSLYPFSMEQFMQLQHSVSKNDEVLRGKSYKYVLRTVLVKDWYDLGPWL